MSPQDNAETQSKDRKNDDPKVTEQETQPMPRKVNFACTITVCVGPEKIPFIVHTDVICLGSKFFKAACGARWIEGQTKVVNLPEEDASAFQYYVEWIYAKGISVPTDVVDVFQARLMDLYVLGDVLDDYQFRNAMMTGLISGVHHGAVIPGPHMFHHVWEHTPVGSNLRQFMVQWVMSSLERHALAKDIESYPEKLFQEIAVAGPGMTLTINSEDLADYLETHLSPETGDK